MNEDVAGANLRQPETVLVVDDDRVSLLVIERALRQSGYSVDTAGGGAEAKKLLNTTSYPAIITETHMPGVGGLELLKHARSRDSNVQVILLSSLASANFPAKARRRDAFNYLPKPLHDLDHLVNVVGNAIALKKALDDREHLFNYFHAPIDTANLALMARTPKELLVLISPVIISAVQSQVVALLLHSPRSLGTTTTNDEPPGSHTFHLHKAPDATEAVVGATIQRMGEIAHENGVPDSIKQLIAESATVRSPAVGTTSELPLVVPLIGSDQWKFGGAIVVGPRDQRPFTVGEIQTLQEIANHLAMVLRRLNQERDLVLRETMAAEIETENLRLQKLSNLKDHLLTTASHELRTPVNAIVGFARLLHDGIDGPLTKAQRHDVERILKNAHNLIAVVDEILDLDRIEQGALPVEAADCNLVDLVRECLETAEALPRDGAIAFIGPIVPEGQGFELVTDAAKVRRILLNLLSNAIHFTQSGKIRAELSHPSPGTVDIHVSDTGPGISAGQRDLIFERFWQAQRLDKESTHPSKPGRSKEGVGIGLNLSRDLATLLGGSLELVDQEAPGACFRLRLPALL